MIKRHSDKNERKMLKEFAFLVSDHFKLMPSQRLSIKMINDHSDKYEPKMLKEFAFLVSEHFKLMHPSGYLLK